MCFVKNFGGEPVNYGAAVMLMDDDIREAIHFDMAPCTDQEFYDEYCRRHEEKYGTSFEVG